VDVTPPDRGNPSDGSSSDGSSSDGDVGDWDPDDWDLGDGYRDDVVAEGRDPDDSDLEREHPDDVNAGARTPRPRGRNAGHRVAAGASGPPEPRVLRLGVIAIVVLVIGLSIVADRSVTRSSPSVSLVAMPVAAPAAAISSSWFCAGPTAGPEPVETGRLVIANAGPRALTGTVRLIPSSGASASQVVRIGPADRLVVPESAPTGATYLGAVVDLDGGQAAVEQVVTGSEGTSSTACASAGGTSWYFPAGTTQEASSLSLELLNPYPDDAIADLSFTTDQGQEDPQDFQGIVVPAGTLFGLDLGSHLHGRITVATTVTLRVGRLVAFETQTVATQTQDEIAAAPTGTVPWPPGVSVVQGTPSPGTSWWWPSGAASASATEQYVIYNPTGNEAQVSLGVDLDQGSADPFQVSVDPYGVAVVISNTESRIPKGIGHGAWLQSTNGVGVVAERLVQASGSSGQTGDAQVLGSRLESGRWLVPGDGAADPVTSTLVVYNPGSEPVTVSISGQRSVSIAGHHRYVSTGNSDGLMLVEAQGQVVVENDVSPAHGIGIDEAIGVPLDQ
jgi:hypothetical protein